jgi:hypothetical protein
MKKIFCVLVLVTISIIAFSQDIDQTIQELNNWDRFSECWNEHFTGFIEIGVCPLYKRWNSNADLDEGYKYTNSTSMVYYSFGLTYTHNKLFTFNDSVFISADIKTHIKDGYNPVNSTYHINSGYRYKFIETGFNYWYFNSNREITNHIDPVMSLDRNYFNFYLAFFVESKYIDSRLTAGISPLNKDSLDYDKEGVFDLRYNYLIFNSFNVKIKPTSFFRIEGQCKIYELDDKNQMSFYCFHIDFFFSMEFSYNQFSLGFRHNCSHSIFIDELWNFGHDRLPVGTNRSYEEIYLKYNF